MKRYVPHACNVGGALLVAYGASAVMLGRLVDMQTNLVWWGQVGVVLLAGLGLIGYSVFRTRAHVAVAAPADACCVDKCCCGCICCTGGSYRERDILALNHLGARFKDDKDGFELCQQVNVRLFAKLYAPSEEPEVVPGDTDAEG
jgi:hypothetical protein